MPIILFLAFVSIPIIEIALFLQVGGLIGTWPTIGIVIATAIAGTVLLRTQGFAVLARGEASMAAGRVPVGEVFDGVCLLLAGALLLTPGFLTDTLGLLLMLPPMRKLLRAWLIGGIERGLAERAAGRDPNRSQGQRRTGPMPAERAPAEDAEYEDIVPEAPPKPTRPPKQSPWRR